MNILIPLSYLFLFKF